MMSNGEQTTKYELKHSCFFISIKIIDIIDAVTLRLFQNFKMASIIL